MAIREEGAATVRQPVLAIGLTVLAAFLLASMDALAKHLSATYAVLFVLWGRYFFHTVLTFAFLSKAGSFGFLRSRRPGLQLLRACLLFGATACMFSAFKYMPLADATAIMFLYPLLITVLSVPLLGERVGARRWAAVAVGFAGILFIAQPGSSALSPTALLPFLAAVSVSLYMIMTRILRGKDDRATTTFYSTAVGALALTLFLPFTWQPANGMDWLMMAMMGATGAATHFLLVRAFHTAPASLLAPFTYSHLVAAVVISIVAFRDIPGPAVILGSVLVAGSGLYVWYRETFVRQPVARPD